MRCSYCKTDKNTDGTPVTHWRCKPCSNEHTKEMRRRNPLRVRATRMRSWWKHRDTEKAQHKSYEERIKNNVFNHYGGYICACCGETIKRFLTIDHMNGGGTKHRREIGGGGHYSYRWITKNGFPEGFQVLCFNCNSGRYLNGGTCPHIEKKYKEKLKEL